MKSRVFLSLGFLLEHSDICDLNNVMELEKLINEHFPREITEIISTSDWFSLTPEYTIFDILSERINDAQLRSAIIGRLSQIFPIHINDDIDNAWAKINACKYYDDKFYYSILCPFKVIQELEGCNIVKVVDDFHAIHLNHLALCPESNEDYAIRCVYLFDKIKFSDNFSDTLSTLGSNKGVVDFSVPITKALCIFNKLDPNIRNIQAAMAWLHAESGFECSPQGSNKDHLFANVKLDDGTETNINCEFHMKISTSNQNDNLKHYSRLYFGLMPVGQSKYSYLLHCGEHL